MSWQPARAAADIEQPEPGLHFLLLRVGPSNTRASHRISPFDMQESMMASKTSYDNFNLIRSGSEDLQAMELIEDIDVEGLPCRVPTKQNPFRSSCI